MINGGKNYFHYNYYLKGNFFSRIRRDFEEFLKATKQLYVPTHTRATPYVFGIILGHYLYNLRRSGRTLNFSKVGCRMNKNWFCTIAEFFLSSFSGFPRIRMAVVDSILPEHYIWQFSVHEANRRASLQSTGIFFLHIPLSRRLVLRHLLDYFNVPEWTRRWVFAGEKYKKFTFSDWNNLFFLFFRF